MIRYLLGVPSAAAAAVPAEALEPPASANGQMVLFKSTSSCLPACLPAAGASAAVGSAGAQTLFPHRLITSQLTVRLEQQ